jgi:hypothetical protein
MRDKTYMVMQANKKSNILQLSYNVYYHIDEIGVCLCLLCFCFDFDFFFRRFVGLCFLSFLSAWASGNYFCRAA